MPVLLVICYPLLVHLSILLDQPLLQAVALISLAIAFSFSGLRRGNKWLWLLLLVIAGAASTLSLIDHSIYLLYVPPVALPAILLVIFGSSLLPGREPLVTAIGEASRGPLSDVMRRYTRGVTWLWTVIFIWLIASGLILPWLDNLTLWSWVTSIWNYIAVAVIFLAEYLFRKWRFPDHNHPGFFEYIRIVVTANVSGR